MGGSDEIVGLSISMLSSSIFINIKNRGLFAYLLHGQLLWSAGPVLYRFGYRQGCKRSVTDCYFTSGPVIDQCEASIYISNSEGEIYSLSLFNPHFKWIQDFSAFDKQLVITPGNNGRVYVTIPVRALVFALDASTGNILWQNGVGPLSTAECSPVVDSNGWISIGSLDGFLYSYSPTGVLKKFPKETSLDSVIQVSPLLDCSGYAVYFSQVEMDGKISRIIGEYTYVSAMKPINAVFTMLVPAIGAIYWKGNYPGQLSSLLLGSDLHHFALDERILLAFVAATKTRNPLPCRTTRQKLASSCAQARSKHLSIYTGNEGEILLFLLFQSSILIVLACFVRFCCIFWRKKKIQGRDLGKFLEKRRSLRVRKKAFDRTITELEQKAAEEAVANEVLEKLGGLVRERKGIERKLSTTYSLGRDGVGLQPQHALPLYDGSTKSYSFRGTKRESFTIFHTLSDTSDETTTSSSSGSNGNSSSGDGEMTWYYRGDKESAYKAKAPAEAGTSRNIGICGEEYQESLPGKALSSKGFTNPLFVEHTSGELKEAHMHEEEVMEPMHQGSSKGILFKRSRTLSSTN
ncbi:PREDICTED: protein GAMETE EXPRESSED 3 isoform X2 [Nelumbo nucifera]|nr:PREDICTED: protein GAMETE EXPRESSED 3 isoform X2 [Nelumbo nucifera]